MKKFCVKALRKFVMGTSAALILASFASAQVAPTEVAPTQEDLKKTVDKFYNKAGVSSSCPEDQKDVPDAPSEVLKQAKNSFITKVWNKVSFTSSTGLTLDPNSPGNVGLKAELYGVTFGKYQIDQLVQELKIPVGDKPEMACDVTVEVAPSVVAIAKAGVAAAKENIIANDPTNTWALNSVDQRGKAIAKDALTQKITASCGIFTNNAYYTCTVGKAPEVLIPSNSTDGMTNSMEAAKNRPDDALRVGSSFSTRIAGCKWAHSLGPNGKIEFGAKGYQNTMPYKDSATFVANGIAANNPGFNAKDPAVVGTLIFNKGTKNFGVNVNAAGGKAEGEIIYNGSTSVRVGNSRISNTASASISQGAYVSPTGKDSADPKSPNFVQVEKGKYFSDVFQVGNISAYVDHSQVNGAPNAAMAKPANGVSDGNTNFTTTGFGLTYTDNSRTGNAGEQARVPGSAWAKAHLSGSVGLQKTTSPDGSLPNSGWSLVGGLTYRTYGGPKAMAKNALKGLKNIAQNPVNPKTDRDDVAIEDIVTHVTTEQNEGKAITGAATSENGADDRNPAAVAQPAASQH